MYKWCSKTAGNMAELKKYVCHLGALKLSLREQGDGSSFKVRVAGRKPANPFHTALVIRPGTVLTLHGKGKETRHIQVRCFAPNLQYGGRMVASGVIHTTTS